ncbi:MAG: nucleotidyltransferase family protein [Magnetospirillum sp.]|nr:nucleotidyltransferase family protein [Magnetospirillum sp.]
MSFRPKRAMVLAAGLGLRMRPITLTTPKPLVPVAGRTMLDRALDHLAAAGVEMLVINTHWLAETIRAHVSGRTGIDLVHEDVLLETGGGVANALSRLGEDAFYVVNSDIIWTDSSVPALERLAAAWEGESMDALLLMQPTATAVGYDGKGDFFLDPAGLPRRRHAHEVAPLLFAGVQILHPRLFADAPSGKFSLNVLYDRALEENRLRGIVHDGRWYHVGTPDALPEVEALFEDRE